MTSKQRAALRAQANTLDALFQVGKGGVTAAVIAQIDDVFKTRELIKIKALLETIPDSPKSLAEQIAAATDCEVVQVIGGAMILYKYNPALHEDKSQAYEKPLSQKVIIKKKAAPKKSGISNKPNSKKRKKRYED